MTDHFDGTDAFLERHGWKHMGGDWWKHAQHGGLSKNDAIGFANKDARKRQAVMVALPKAEEPAGPAETLGVVREAQLQYLLTTFNPATASTAEIALHTAAKELMAEMKHARQHARDWRVFARNQAYRAEHAEQT